MNGSNKLYVSNHQQEELRKDKQLDDDKVSAFYYFSVICKD